MKKKLLIVLMIMAVCTLALGFTACKPTSEQPPVHSIELEYYVYEIDLLEEVTLSAITTADAEDVEWSSSDESVATVSAGKITPISVGETVITAKVGNQSATCYLNVVDKQEIPSLIVSENNLTMLVGDEFPLEVNLTYLNKQCEGVIYSFSSTDEDVLTVDANGVITAKGKGSARIKVVAQWKTVDKDYTTKYVDVSIVRDVSLNFNVDKCDIYAIASLQGVDYKNTQSVSCTAYEQSVELSVPVSYELENDEICSFENGVVTGKKAGKTRLTASIEYDGDVYSDSIEIEIKHVVLEKDIDYTLSRLKADVSSFFESGIEATKVVKYDGDNATEFTVTDGIIDGATAFNTHDIVKLGVYNDKFGYIVDNVKVLDLLIKDASDIDLMRKATTGYFELANDVNLKGKNLVASSETFSGTLDGKGYSLIAPTFSSASNNGLFYSFSGVIKNLVITDAILNGQGGVICNTVGSANAIIDNVYISVASMAVEGIGALARNIWTTPTITNTVICIKAVTPTTTYTETYMDGSSVTGMKVGMLAYDGGTGVDFSTIKLVTDVANLQVARVPETKTFTEITTRQEFFTKNAPYSINDFRVGVEAGTIAVNDKTKALLVANDGITRISTEEQFLAMRNETVGTFVLVNDITLTKPLEGNSTVFTGTFDGNGFAIINATIKSNGIFYTMKGTFKNVAIVDATLIGQGGIVSYNISSIGKIDNVYISIKKLSVEGSGGIVRNGNASAKITNCVVYVKDVNSNLAVKTNTYTNGSESGYKLGAFAYSDATAMDATTNKFVSDVANLKAYAISGSTSDAVQTFNANNPIISVANFKSGVTAGTITIKDVNLLNKILG